MSASNLKKRGIIPAINPPKPKSEVRQIEATIAEIQDDGTVILRIPHPTIGGIPLGAEQWRAWSKSPDEPLGYIQPARGLRVFLTGIQTDGLRRFKITRLP